MGQISLTRIITLTIIFFLASVIVFWQPPPHFVEKQLSLDQALTSINNWKQIGKLPLDQKIIDALKLDDYTYQNFSNGKDIITLYVGYYYSTNKVGAAHDPRICFHGQGWELSRINKEKLLLNPDTKKAISISLMTAQKEDQKDMIIFWYQSYDSTSTDTFSQKLISFSKKLQHNREDNAFIRITTSAGEKSLSQSRDIIVSFIRSFYPVFLNYIKEDGSINSLK